MLSFRLFSLVYLILSSPNNWTQVLFLNSDIVDFSSLPQNVKDYLSIIQKAIILMELIPLTIGMVLLVIPYLLVSLKLFIGAIRGCLKRNGDYPKSHDLTRVLIEKHNAAYHRRN
ncbi:hypothetical protein LOD99_13385 [Oopsacas minuta]|uniref:Uncharacterized protein n=1 Tax=Oopsacas minuta TaxID=111878 RepID=A0AAV7KJA7_9METZ|nr:hypothetical protein LOD99_13385 [Oopsacas minuta]